jgi:hypothetical protein
VDLKFTVSSLFFTGCHPSIVADYIYLAAHKIWLLAIRVRYWAMIIMVIHSLQSIVLGALQSCLPVFIYSLAAMHLYCYQCQHLIHYFNVAAALTKRKMH